MRNIYLQLAALAALLLFLTAPGSVSAQSSAWLELPYVDNAALQTEEMKLAAPGRPPRFAVAHEVDIRPATHGEWTERGGNSVWRLGLRSAGAYSLNLGFTEYYLPPGAELSIYRGKGKTKTGPFTAADNELHKQLWTPIIPGEALVIELAVPTARRSLAQLRLTKVNHDFGGLGLVVSGSCNLDVECGTADGWNIVDRYRDIIQAAALYSINGSVTCSGALINNARQDCTPYFLTASHCGVQANSAPSVVVYWNFANSTCRQPNSAASGGNGDGNLDNFNTGAILRANYAQSDVTLLELDDPVSPTADAFFAGWDRRFEPPTDTIVAIHHPRLDEKRISFSFQDMFRVNGISSDPVPDGTHIAVPSWDIGTTEGGSSGSPVFDRFKRIRGQLHGGVASCSVADYDAYGFLAQSWAGGGTPATRLSDWLDPDDAGAEFIDGRSVVACSEGVVFSPASQRVCAGEMATYELTVGGGFAENVSFAANALPEGVAVAFSANNVQPGSILTLTLTTDGNLASGVFDISIDVTWGASQQATTLTLIVEGDVASPPALLLPANNATGVSPNVNLSWETAGNVSEYAYQLSSDAAFANVIAQDTTASVSTILSDLQPETTYFWRIRSINICGAGPWSVGRQFTTGAVSCAAIPADNLPRSIPDNSSASSLIEVTFAAQISELSINNLRIDHTYIGDLRVELTSPSQTTVVLFDRIGYPEAPFGCGGEDLLLDFSDSAPQSAFQLENSCNTEEGFGAQGSYQPLDPFLAFAGEPTQGTWRLRVFDNAADDTGRLISWELNLCATLPDNDLALSLVSAPTASCASAPAKIVVKVGGGFGDDFSTALRVNGNPYLGFSSSFDTENRELTIALPSLVGFQAGANDVEVILIAGGEDANAISFTLERVNPPLLPVPVGPAPGAVVPPQELVTYTWQAAAGAEDYRLQFSTLENFSTILSEEVVAGTMVERLPPAGVNQWFWRVISTNDCGDGVSAGRSIALRTNATVNLAGGTIDVLPNPTFGTLYLETSANWSAGIQLRLFGTSGRLLQQGELRPGPQRHELDLSQLPAGVYWLELRAAGERRMTKVVKLR